MWVKYQIKIDSQFKKGYMNGSHAIIKGKVKKEILFSSYICHPSMANNELSGIIVSCALMSYFQKKKPSKTEFKKILQKKLWIKKK